MRATGYRYAKALIEKELSKEWAAIRKANVCVVVSLNTKHAEVNYHNCNTERAESPDCKSCEHENETTRHILFDGEDLVYKSNHLGNRITTFR